MSTLEERLDAMSRRAHEPIQASERQVIHGTPISPTSRLAQMDRTSFCVSHWNRRPLAPYLERLAPDGTLLIDNGAYSMWTHGMREIAAGRPAPIADAKYWQCYYLWAIAILREVPQAILIIPDVIMGSEADNRRLILELPPEVPPGRAMPVWHLHESMGQLEFLVEAFGQIAFGSSGEFRNPGTLPWRQRIAQALEHVERICSDPANGIARPRIHMLRGLGPMRDAEFPFATADSTNLARNGHLWIRRGRSIVDFQRLLEGRSYPRAAGSLWPEPSDGPVGAAPTRKATQLPLFVTG